MIKTLSPYYVDIPYISPITGLTCSSFVLKLYVWNGSKTSVPTEPTYVITISNPEGLTNNRKINISNLINSSLDFSARNLTGNTLNNGDNQMWCKKSVFYNTTEPTEAETPQNQETLLFSKGYGYSMEGENPTTPTDKILMQGREFKVSNNTNFTIPIIVDETPSPMITIISYPNNVVNDTIAVSTTLFSGELVKYLNIDTSLALGESYIEVTYNGEIITLLITEECRYTTHDINFINKEGAQQVFTMFKKRTDNISITNEKYESFRGQPLLGNHQFITYNTQAKKDFKLNTGFVSEDLNDTITQIMLSDRLWIRENDILTPIILKGKSLSYKTRQNDRLINYELSFEYAFNEVNNI